MYEFGYLRITAVNRTHLSGRAQRVLLATSYDAIEPKTRGFNVRWMMWRAWQILHATSKDAV